MPLVSPSCLALYWLVCEISHTYKCGCDVNGIESEPWKVDR